jgi:hypothetical protein
MFYMELQGRYDYQVCPNGLAVAPTPMPGAEGGKK